MDKGAQFVQGLLSCFTVQLFEKRTGHSVEWLADHVKVTPSDDPDAGPLQWPVDWPYIDLHPQHLSTLQAAALVALWWRDAMADAPFLTDAQRDALTARNLIDEQAAQRELERDPKRKGAALTNGPYEKARQKAREIAEQRWMQRPDMRKDEMITVLKADLSSVPDVAMPSDRVLWDWLKEWPQRGGQSVIPATAQRAGRPKSTGR